MGMHSSCPFKSGSDSAAHRRWAKAALQDACQQVSGVADLARGLHLCGYVNPVFDTLDRTETDQD
jgi:hypothetical protein